MHNHCNEASSCSNGDYSYTSPSAAASVISSSVAAARAPDCTRRLTVQRVGYDSCMLEMSRIINVRCVGFQFTLLLKVICVQYAENRKHAYCSYYLSVNLFELITSTINLFDRQ